jgi:hypothetical protein
VSVVPANRRQSILLLFECTDGEQTLIPALLQLGGDQSVLGINRVVLTASPLELSVEE